MAVSELGGDTVADFDKLFGGEFEMLLLEIKVAFTVDRHQMDMGMRHFESDNSHCDAFAGDGFLDGISHMFGEHHHLSEFFIVDIEDVVGFMFGNDEGMSCRQGVDVEKSKKLFVFGDFITGDFALNDFSEDGGHG